MIILHVPQAFEDALGSIYVRVLNMARLYMQMLHRVICWLHMPQCLNMAQYALISLKMPVHG